MFLTVSFKAIYLKNNVFFIIIGENNEELILKIA